VNLPPLHELDERWLPRAAMRLQRTTGRLKQWAGRPGPRHLRTAVRDEPALVGSILAVLVAGVLLATVGEPAGARITGSGAGRSSTLSAAVATIGPTPGTSVASYLTHAAFDLRHFGEVSRGRPTYAVVDLRSFVTPAQAQAIFGAANVVRAYVRVRAGDLPTLVRSFPLQTAAAIPTGMLNVATIAKATATSYALSIKALHPKNAAERGVKRRYDTIHRAALREAAALARPASCRCVFAVVVRADFLRLSLLARTPQVRAVDPAPPEVELTGLTALPLDPTATRVVPGTGLPQTRSG